MTDRHPIWKLLDGAQQDLNDAQAKLVALRSFVAGLNLPAGDQPKWPCPECGIRCSDARAVDEHVYRVHDGPEPSHWSAES